MKMLNAFFKNSSVHFGINVKLPNDLKLNFSADFAVRGFPIGLYHPLDGVTNPRYKLLYFVKTKKNMQREEGTSF